MKQTRMWPHADSIVPVDWDATSPHREAFSRLVLARSVREMGDYWVQQSVTQGLTPPSTQRSSPRDVAIRCQRVRAPSVIFRPATSTTRCRSSKMTGLP